MFVCLCRHYYNVNLLVCSNNSNNALHPVKDRSHESVSSLQHMYTTLPADI